MPHEGALHKDFAAGYHEKFGLHRQVSNGFKRERERERELCLIKIARLFGACLKGGAMLRFKQSMSGISWCRLPGLPDSGPNGRSTDRADSRRGKGQLSSLPFQLQQYHTGR